jgi:hypothetical protein
MANIVQRIQEFFTTSTNVAVHQYRTFTTRIRRSLWRQPTKEWGRADYAYWRRAYRARVAGLEISGLFIKPLVSKISGWALGRAPDWRCESEASQDALETWWTDNHTDVLKAYRESLKQGDSFLVVNADLTITLLSPDTVDPIVADDDFANIIGWRVSQTLQHPESNDRMVVVDEYYADRRVHRVETNTMQAVETVFPNLIGIIPLVHIPNQPDDNETFGHAEAEALVEVLHRYGAVFEAAIEGNILQGRPTPVINFETQADLDKFWTIYGKRETRTLPDGSSETVNAISVDLTQILTVSGAEFDYKTPGSFAADTAQLLEILFYMILEHTELPEFVMGNAISSSKASADTQMPVFEKFIEARQGEMKWIISVAEIVLAYLSLLEPGVVAEKPTVQWKKITQDGTLTLETIKWGLTEGLLDRRTALLLAPVQVEDIDAVLDAAQEEMDARQELAREEAQFNADLNAEISNLENA